MNQRQPADARADLQSPRTLAFGSPLTQASYKELLAAAILGRPVAADMTTDPASSWRRVSCAQAVTERLGKLLSPEFPLCAPLSSRQLGCGRDLRTGGTLELASKSLDIFVPSQCVTTGKRGSSVERKDHQLMIRISAIRVVREMSIGYPICITTCPPRCRGYKA